MKIIGLTGGIATGKSTVSSWFAQLHYPVVDADLIAREVVHPGQVPYFMIIDEFGPGILNNDETKSINRQKLGSLIFNNPEKRQMLNSITHPYIRIRMLRKVLMCFLLGYRVCILDTPLLFEAHLDRWVHVTIVAYCPEATQKQRLVSRDNLTVDQATARITSQLSIEKKKSLADIVVDNSGSLSETKSQVVRLAKKLLPSRIQSFVIWSVLVGPAAMLYLCLSLYLLVDRCRHIGFWKVRQVPAEIPSEERVSLPSKPGLKVQGQLPAAASAAE